MRIRESEYKLIKFALLRKSNARIKQVEMMINNNRLRKSKLIRIKKEVIYKNKHNLSSNQQSNSRKLGSQKNNKELANQANLIRSKDM